MGKDSKGCWDEQRKWGALGWSLQISAAPAPEKIPPPLVPQLRGRVCLRDTDLGELGRIRPPRSAFRG